jgi:SPP1 gp7 family putative phage head morphogenesis protein
MFLKLVDEIVTMILSETDGYDTILEDNLGGVSTMMNLGRDRTAIATCKKVEYSAILDKRTCPLCKFLDGQVFEVNSPEYFKYMPRVHERCRCIYVYVGQEEVNPPDIKIKKPDAEMLKTHGHLIGTPETPVSETASLIKSMFVHGLVVEALKSTREQDKTNPVTNPEDNQNTSENPA